jgi:ABC-type antimicrobial peptide transport system permease subunit
MFALTLVAAFGVLGFVLAMGGVYAVVSYVVEHRTRKLGLRLALGATPSAVGWMIVRQVLLVTLAGVFCGFIMAAAFTQGLSALLFGVTRFDLETTCGVAVALITAALVASVAPVVRAARVDPMVALRFE